MRHKPATESSVAQGREVKDAQRWSSHTGRTGITMRNMPLSPMGEGRPLCATCLPLTHGRRVVYTACLPLTHGRRVVYIHSMPPSHPWEESSIYPACLPLIHWRRVVHTQHASLSPLGGESVTYPACLPSTLGGECYIPSMPPYLPLNGECYIPSMPPYLHT